MKGAVARDERKRRTSSSLFSSASAWSNSTSPSSSENSSSKSWSFSPSAPPCKESSEKRQIAVRARSVPAPYLS